MINTDKISEAKAIKDGMILVKKPPGRKWGIQPFQSLSS